MGRINAIAFVILVVFLVLFVARRHPPQPIAEQTSSILYSCNNGRTIQATYYAGEASSTPSGTVDLVLSDGRRLTLSQTMSADGIRYANTDESFVFWGKGNGALVLENNQQKSYIGCIGVVPAPNQNLSKVYSNSAAAFSIRIPQEYIVDEFYHYRHLGPGKSIAGIKFTVATSTAFGTNLSPDTYLSVEEIPQIKNCSAALFLANASPKSVTDGTFSYSVATSSGAAAGNRYDELVYALPGTNPCIGIRYYIHYGVIENYPPGQVREFDKQALLETFDAIRRTIVIVQ
jgi:membrane-bound inhibitor of C-type lysozyme